MAHKASRNVSMEKFMKNPRMEPSSGMSFDGNRMIFGGFAPVVRLPA